MTNRKIPLCFASSERNSRRLRNVMNHFVLTAAVFPFLRSCFGFNDPLNDLLHLFWIPSNTNALPSLRCFPLVGLLLSLRQNNLLRQLKLHNFWLAEGPWRPVLRAGPLADSSLEILSPSHWPESLGLCWSPPPKARGGIAVSFRYCPRPGGGRLSLPSA